MFAVLKKMHPFLQKNRGEVAKQFGVQTSHRVATQNFHLKSLYKEEQWRDLEVFIWKVLRWLDYDVFFI